MKNLINGGFHRCVQWFEISPILVIPFFIIAVFSGSCALDSPPAGTSSSSHTPISSTFPVTLQDSNGDEVIIVSPPQRIVAIDSDAVEILFAIGEGHRVVGTHNFNSFIPELDVIERIGDAFALNYEKISALNPDLIIVFFDSPLSDLKKLGVPVLYRKTPETLSEVAYRMRSWGMIVDNPEAAEILAVTFEAFLSGMTAQLAGIDEGPRVFHDLAPGLWTVGSGTMFEEIYGLLKAKNIFAELEGYKQVSAEELVARDPQIVIITYPDGLDAFTTDAAFQGISARINDKLFVIDGALVSVTGPRLTQGITKIAEALYPDIFLE